MTIERILRAQHAATLPSYFCRGLKLWVFTRGNKVVGWLIDSYLIWQLCHPFWLLIQILKNGIIKSFLVLRALRLHCYLHNTVTPYLRLPISMSLSPRYVRTQESPTKEEALAAMSMDYLVTQNVISDVWHFILLLWKMVDGLLVNTTNSVWKTKLMLSNILLKLGIYF